MTVLIAGGAQRSGLTFESVSSGEHVSDEATSPAGTRWRMPIETARQPRYDVSEFLNQFFPYWVEYHLLLSRYDLCPEISHLMSYDGIMTCRTSAGNTWYS